MRVKRRSCVKTVKNHILERAKNNAAGGVKLTAGFIFKDKAALNQALAALEKRFGKIDFVSPSLAFTYTDYYENEFGTQLKRQFVSFSRLIAPERLAEIKLITNRIERRLSKGSRRLVNIDPGYLDMAKLVLATTKDYRHRIYLNKGIFAEITLCYRGRTFTPWEWTYPDYRSADYIGIFNRIRQIYADQIKEEC